MMLVYFKLLISLCIPLLLGIFGIAAVLRKRLTAFSYLERLALAFASGVWILILIMFSLPLINLPLSFQNIAFAAGLLLIGLFPFSLRSLIHFVPKSLPKLKSFWFYLLLLAISIKVLFVFWSALLKPMIDPDIIQCYALAVKHTFLNQIPIYPASKPPLPFLIESWPLISIDAWQDNLLPFFYPFLYISFLIIFYSGLKRHFSELYSLFFTFLLASLPLLLFHAGTAYTDFPQAFYYSAATIYLFQFVKEFNSSRDKAHSFFLASMLFLGIAVWVKRSALLYYSGINLSVLALFLVYHWKNIQKGEWRNLAFGFLLFTIIILPWIIYHNFVSFSQYYGQAIPALKQTISHPRLAMAQVILLAMLRNMFSEGNWQLLWMFFFSLLVLFPRKSFTLPNSVLLIILAVNLSALFAIFLFTNLFISIFNDTILNRLMLHFVPVVLYFCAETCSTK